MGRQIVQQPDGKYSIWSTIVDDFIVVDCENAAEIIEVLVEDSRAEIEAYVGRVLIQLTDGEKPYHQFTKTYAQCIEIRNEVHSDHGN